MNVAILADANSTRRSGMIAPGADQNGYRYQRTGDRAHARIISLIPVALAKAPTSGSTGRARLGRRWRDQVGLGDRPHDHEVVDGRTDRHYHCTDEKRGHE
jgi:hypothetical protein